MAMQNCSKCDYCYSDETMGELHICVKGNSEMFGQAVDYLGLADDDMDCVVINGKDRDKINADKYEMLDDIEIVFRIAIIVFGASLFFFFFFLVMIIKKYCFI